MRKSKLYAEMLDELSKSFESLPDKPEESVEASLDALWIRASGIKMVVEVAEHSLLPALSRLQESKLVRLVEERKSGTPLAHLTGRQRFMNLDFKVSAHALIPRKETELVGYAALELIQGFAVDAESVMVLDICSGVGNLGLAFAYHEPKALVFGADLSSRAVALATKNAVEFNLSDRMRFYSGDLMEPFRSREFFGKADVLTCNPPYISSGKLKSMPNEIIDHEPDLAFNGGPFGVSILIRLIKEAPEFIKPGGWLAFEIGAGQGQGVRRMLKKNPKYDEVRSVKDGEGQVRALLAKLII